MLLRILLENLTRLLLIGAASMMGLAFLELAAQLLGQSLLRSYYSPGRLMELSATLAVLAIALLLRDVRNGLKIDRESRPQARDRETS